MPEQVDHSLHPNGSHCYFKRADICWRAERGSFQRNDESPVLDCSERGPHERMRTWQEGWKGERKSTFKQQSPLFFHLILLYSHTLYLLPLFSVILLFPLYISASCLSSFDINENVDKSIFFLEIDSKTHSSHCYCSICYNRFHHVSQSVV